jgi:hypothetical protein
MLHALHLKIALPHPLQVARPARPRSLLPFSQLEHLIAVEEALVDVGVLAVSAYSPTHETHALTEAKQLADLIDVGVLELVPIKDICNTSSLN